MGARVYLKIALAVFASFTVVACSGGTNSQSMPPDPILNTSQSSYLPLATGNVWQFDHGVRFVDLGSVTNLACNDVGNAYERIAAYTSAQSTTPAWSFFFAPGPPAMLKAISSGDGTVSSNTSCFEDYRNPYWLAVPSASSKVGDTYTCSAAIGGSPGCITSPPETATITAVGQTIQVSGGKIIDVDTEVDSQLSGAPGTTITGPTITWSFAQGVGFTSYQDSTYDLNLVSFELH